MIQAVIFDKNGLFVGGLYEQAMFALAKILRQQGLQLYLLSNGSGSDREKMQPYFDGLYYSSLTGFAKPDPQAFQMILNQHNLQPEECVFFDDMQDNVDVANHLGLQAFFFESAEQVREIISELSTGPKQSI